MSNWKKFFSVVLILFLFLILFIRLGFSNATHATVSECSVWVSPTNIAPNSSGSLRFTITNNGQLVSIVWVKITSPSGNFTITSGTKSGWTGSVSGSSVTFTGGSQAAGVITGYDVATTTSSETAQASWTVQVSDAANGSGATTCTGETRVAISNSAADVTAPSQGDVTVTGVSDSSVTLTWTTDEAATSTTNYGTTDSYGQSVSETTAVTSHSVTLSSLSANTTYHFYITNTDVFGNSADTEDNTFTISKGTTTTTTTTTTITAPTPSPKIISDSTKPQVTITTDLTNPFDKAPKIVGKASDTGDANPGISKIEYSIDDGKNWLDVDNIKSPNAKSTIFDFTPIIFEDGNYKIKVRVKDNSGNLVTTKVLTLVIDRLPPSVGGVLFSVGPLIISPDPNGIIFALKGLDQKITLSSIGGSTEIEILSTASVIASEAKQSLDLEKEIATGSVSPRNDEKVQMFPLAKNIENGLWSGQIKFEKAGVYKLIAKSVDGAGNTTKRELNRVYVLEGGKVSDKDGNSLKDAKITLFNFNVSNQQYTIWDGKPFGQQNPQKVNSEGSYKLLIPPGKYYLQISSPGFKTQKTNILSLNTSMSLNTGFTLKRANGIKIGPFSLYLSDFKQDEVVVDVNLPDEIKETPLHKKKVLNQELPYFSFNIDDKETTANDFKGKPSILSFMSTWSPQTPEQLNILNSLPSAQLNAAVIMEQETASRVNIFKKKGGYKLPILADRDGELIEPLNILNLPTNIFLDRKGIVKNIKVGVLSKDEILENLVN